MISPGRRGFVGAAAVAVVGCACGLARQFSQAPRPTRRMLAGFPTMKQPDDISCGPTSAAMVLHWYGIPAGVEACTAKAGTRWLELGPLKIGMTLPSGVVSCLGASGLPSRIAQGTIEDVVRHLDEGRPPILLVRSGPSTWHWLVAIGYLDGGARLRLSDPAGRQWTISRRQLDSAWDFSTDLAGGATWKRRCARCNGAGDCSACDGSGQSPDICRQVVEAFGVAGRTMVVPDRGRTPATPR